MKYRVVHRTEYHYSDAATICHNIAHLAPRGDVTGQTVTSRFLSVVPQPVRFEEMTDHFGNLQHYFSIETPHRDMVVTATSIVETGPDRGGLPSSTCRWEDMAAALGRLPPAEQGGIREYTLESPMVPVLTELEEFARPSFAAFPLLVDAALDLVRRIHTEFQYDPSFTTLATPLGDVIRHRRGVCQDFAHLAIGCFRAFGIAARYVSGYLETLPPEGGEKLVGADASHAWVSVFLPEAGWLCLDPTNNQPVDHRYITIGWGRDYSDLPPLKGVIVGGGAHTLQVSVDVEPMT